MLETVTFPVSTCAPCGTERMYAQDLDDNDELIMVCLHCDAPLPEGAEPKYLGARSLRQYGYDIEGEIESRGCGSSGGESSCSGSCGSGC